MLLIQQEIIGKMSPVHGPSNVVIDPFNPKHLGPNTYDVSLGSWYYRMQEPKLGTPRIYNPYSENDVAELWGEPQQAQRAGVVFRSLDLDVPDGINLDDSVIIVNPLEMILCHTEEFIGGLNCVAGWMQGKSGWSRSCISVCRDAGLGDVGYVNRWTMEMTNHNPYLAVPLIVGQPIAKIAFLTSMNWLDTGKSYEGSYQAKIDPSGDPKTLQETIDQIKSSWTPANMLPRIYRRNRIG